MLSLDSPLWLTLHHTYGSAADIPDLLRQLEDTPSESVNEWSGPWNALSEALCHGGIEVNVASYAALPHILRIGMTFAAPEARWGYFTFLGTVETLRLQGRGPDIPEDLRGSYFAAFRKMHEWIFQLVAEPWDYLLVTSITAAVAASKGHADLASILSDLSPDNLKVVSHLLEGDKNDTPN